MPTRAPREPADLGFTDQALQSGHPRVGLAGDGLREQVSADRACPRAEEPQSHGLSPVRPAPSSCTARLRIRCCRTPIFASRSDGWLWSHRRRRCGSAHSRCRPASRLRIALEVQPASTRLIRVASPDRTASPARTRRRVDELLSKKSPDVQTDPNARQAGAPNTARSRIGAARLRAGRLSVGCRLSLVVRDRSSKASLGWR